MLSVNCTSVGSGWPRLFIGRTSFSHEPQIVVLVINPWLVQRKSLASKYGGGVPPFEPNVGFTSNPLDVKSGSCAHLDERTLVSVVSNSNARSHSFVCAAQVM